jgi:hypothetical protein
MREVVAAVADDEVGARVVERRAGEAREVLAGDVPDLGGHLDGVDGLDGVAEDAPQRRTAAEADDQDRARAPVQQHGQVAEQVLHVAHARRLGVAADVQPQEVALLLDGDDRGRALAVVDHLVVVGLEDLLHLRA